MLREAKKYAQGHTVNEKVIGLEFKPSMCALLHAAYYLDVRQFSLSCGKSELYSFRSRV